MFEAIQFIEQPGRPEPNESSLGEFENEMDAVEAARDARREFMTGDRGEYAWWVVREIGASLASFIADSKSDKEFMLDLTSGELVEIT